MNLTVAYDELTDGIDIVAVFADNAGNPAAAPRTAVVFEFVTAINPWMAFTTGEYGGLDKDGVTVRVAAEHVGDGVFKATTANLLPEVDIVVSVVQTTFDAQMETDIYSRRYRFAALSTATVPIEDVPLPVVCGGHVLATNVNYPNRVDWSHRKGEGLHSGMEDVSGDTIFSLTTNAENGTTISLTTCTRMTTFKTRMRLYADYPSLEVNATHTELPITPVHRNPDPR